MAEPTAKIRKYFDDIIARITSTSMMRRLGGFLIITIRDRTRGKGEGVSQPGGQSRQLKRVSALYSLRRANMKNRHPESATGTRSNLTASGALLDSMMLKRASQSQLFIGFKNRQNELKAEGQEAQGRRFLVLSSAEILAARKYVAKIVADES
jgi:hypothetical protein